MPGFYVPVFLFILFLSSNCITVDQNINILKIYLWKNLSNTRMNIFIYTKMEQNKVGLKRKNLFIEELHKRDNKILY